jgi:hypothetical protein
MKRVALLINKVFLESGIIHYLQRRKGKAFQTERIACTNKEEGRD